MTIKDSENQTTLTLMGIQAKCLFGFTCEDLLKKTHCQTQQALPEEMQKTMGRPIYLKSRLISMASCW